ncbi:MAG: septum formation initiator family protein [Erysipelotrichaceae bacterium]|nr:septum formation initiator family protein [Erysipelotrichaceae bacterium]MBR3150872.1 septum formation initiator family protein [Erysipelotrichaceae bacterium]MBR3168654.1 septum formation initiator family protein [Erysipelotrichaceae bacterium]
MSTKKKKRSRIIPKLIACLMLVVAIYLFVGVGQQIFTTLKLQRQKELVEAELKILEEENASLVAQKTKLEDPNYIETYARGEYMFSKDDEKVFYLPSASEETANTESPSAAPEGGSQ